MIDRHELLNELDEEQKLRKYIRKGLKSYLEHKNDQQHNQVVEEQRLREHIQYLISQTKEKQSHQLTEENQLRNIVRGLIHEIAKTDVPADQPHVNTGINVLEDLLRNIVPIVEEGYKALTSAKEQRVSFREHILNAVENTLLPAEVVAGVPHGEESEVEIEELEEQDVSVNIEDEEDKFIPVRDIDVEPEEEEVEVEEEDTFTIAGSDLTGRNFAANTWNKVEKQTLDAYESLADEEDRMLFKDYLLTNFKLYFDKFEDELQANLPEPESPDYEKPAGLEEPIEELPPL